MKWAIGMYPGLNVSCNFVLREAGLFRRATFCRKSPAVFVLCARPGAIGFDARIFCAEHASTMSILGYLTVTQPRNAS